MRHHTTVRPSRKLLAALAAVAALLLVPGCGSDTGSKPDSSSTESPQDSGGYY
jgi:ABC-type phosphate transport system substrate-binding protein